MLKILGTKEGSVGQRKKEYSQIVRKEHQMHKERKMNEKTRKSWMQ